MAGPQVVAAGPKDMLLYYHAFDVSARAYAVGLATSEDGFRCALPAAGWWRLADCAHRPSPYMS